ncbi:MAG: hypothetical protein KatS3mg002_1386 [Candidatus Woesearchaeota archaeon]|nr:MAG: hypothetical protein KatS3mg002_1386 [Candidatus Woesearchaeota archaeon]
MYLFSLLLTITLTFCEPYRNNIIIVAESQIGVKEVTTNWSPKIAEYLDSCNVYVPAPWCVSFIGWVYKRLKLNTPLSCAWSPSWNTTDTRIDKENWQPGDIGTLYYPSKGRIGHGFIIKQGDKKNAITIEGNTNIEGSPEGDRVMVRIRPWTTIYTVNNWVGDKIHKVKSGDTLYSIARKYKTTIDKLIELNSLSDKIIKVNQILIIECGKTKK